ncbi:unnamed protein product [Caenorhabditis sp. 36 PRJEB53466]|nr:unnamed protein product [Caenorhabditis sp. 36 PRJEB53466]
MTCTFENSYFESEAFLRTTLHFMTVFEVPLNIFGAYLIIRKSPKSMSSARGVILLLHTASAIMDFFVTFLIIPYEFSPYPFVYPVGFLSFRGVSSPVQVYIASNVMAAVAISLVVFFENRYNAVVIGKNGGGTRRNAKRYALFVLDMGMCAVLAVQIFWQLPDSKTAREHFLEKHSCVPLALLDNPNFIDINAGSVAMPIYLAIVLVFIFSQSSFFVLYTFYHLFFSTKIVSRSTQQLQRKFFIALLMQAFIPLIVLAGPIAYGYISWYIWYYNQKYNNFKIIAIGFNGFLTTITMILVHSPYRNAVKEIIPGIVKKWKATVAHAPSGGSHSPEPSRNIS